MPAGGLAGRPRGRSQAQCREHSTGVGAAGRLPARASPCALAVPRSACAVMDGIAIRVGSSVNHVASADPCQLAVPSSAWSIPAARRRPAWIWIRSSSASGPSSAPTAAPGSLARRPAGCARTRVKASRPASCSSRRPRWQITRPRRLDHGHKAPRLSVCSAQLAAVAVRGPGGPVSTDSSPRGTPAHFPASGRSGSCQPP